MTKFDFTDEKVNKVRFSVSIPESWDEMTADQVQFIFYQYERAIRGEITPIQLQVLAVYKIVGLVRAHPTRRASRCETIIENINTLRSKLDFIFADAADGELPRLTFRSIKNPIPQISVKRRILKGPASLCQDLTFGEFRNAALALNTFFRTEAPTDLDECIAHLYRPVSSKANKAGRKVKPVEPETFDEEVKVIANAPSWQKNLIMLWFASCIGYLQSETIILGGEEVDMKLLFAGTGEDQDGPAATWNDLLVQISKEGTIGNIEEVDAAPLMVVLLNMWSNYKENKRNERKIRKAKKG